ncbi:hypothetical protein ACJMK2_013096 [Sinanodonta woodiana]|uniref:Uncharacterized protein n=1 Tax=Sinanodonta woodiana TaxID=1069815 RepID=A0ABD3VBV2_SINWO
MSFTNSFTVHTDSEQGSDSEIKQERPLAIELMRRLSVAQKQRRSSVTKQNNLSPVKHKEMEQSFYQQEGEPSSTEEEKRHPMMQEWRQSPSGNEEEKRLPMMQEWRQSPSGTEEAKRLPMMQEWRQSPLDTDQEKRLSVTEINSFSVSAQEHRQSLSRQERIPSLKDWARTPSLTEQARRMSITVQDENVFVFKDLQPKESLGDHDDVMTFTPPLLWHLELESDTETLVERTHYFTHKHENIYRGLLRCLLHPLGSTKSTLGLRTGDLIDYLKEVFDVDRDDHEYFIREEVLNKPGHLQVNVGIIEASGLPISGTSDETPELYCLSSVIHPSRSSLKANRSPLSSPWISPKNSPNISPSTSPKLVSTFRQGSSIDQLIHRTQAIKSLQPKWNDEFQIELEDYLTDEIHIYVCNQDHNKLEPEGKHHHGLGNLFGFLRHTEHDKLGNEVCLGRIIIPVKEIAAEGSDAWFEITSLGTTFNKPKVVGKCHLKLSVSYTQDEYNGGMYFSHEDYCVAVKKFVSYECSKIKSSSPACPSDSLMSCQDQCILNMFSVAHQISGLSQNLALVICLLEQASSNQGHTHIDMTLPTALDKLHMTWAAMQLNQKDISQKMPITDAEIYHYRKAVGNYIHCKVPDMSELPSMFPPCLESLSKVKLKLGVSVQLLNLDLWEPNCSSRKSLHDKVVKRLQDDILKWIDNQITSISDHELVKDTVILEIPKLTDVISLASSHCNVLGVVRQFYNALGINYYREVVFVLERQIAGKARELMVDMDKYNKRYHNFQVNITLSSRHSLKLFFTLRKFFSVVRDNVNHSDLFRLSISSYQSWFNEALIFWLQTFRSEMVSRMEKALVIDKDVIVATSLVKYSNSSVDVLSCFAKVIEEWQKIDFGDPDCAQMGVTKVTDLICDGVRLYADKIHHILEKNGYYDGHRAEFDVTERLCITINNIEHVRQYLEELPKLLCWDSVNVIMSTTYESDKVGDQVLTVLQRLISTTNMEIHMKCRLLTQQIVEKMRVEMDKCIEIFTQKSPEKASSVDRLIGYLISNIKTLKEQLMQGIYPLIIEQLWKTTLVSLDEQLMIGQQPDYYTQMQQHLRALMAYFMRSGLCDDQINSIENCKVKERLDLNCMKSEDLMLKYFSNLAVKMTTPTEYYGHLAIKAAYMEETRGNVTIFIKVVQGLDLPGLDRSGLSDPYVIISLQPHVIFNTSKPQQTHVVEKTCNPVYNTTFSFPNTPKERLKKEGTVILLTVLDRDQIGSDDFAGEIVLRLSSIPCIKMHETVDSTPVVMMPVKRPSHPHEGAFQVLQERISWDKMAKAFVNERLRFIEHQRERTDKPTTKTGFFSWFF